MKLDDATLDLATEKQVRKYADLLLKKGGAYGRFPTPVSDLVEAAELEIARENVLDKVFLGGLYRSLPNSLKLTDRLKSALGKVMGLLDRRDRTVHIDKDLHPKKVVFLSIHEVGHDFLPWQRKTFDILEDSDSELDPETRDKYEREANCFSSDVLFQLDTFAKEAADSKFSIYTPLTLSKRYGASFYATARRYVATSGQACARRVQSRSRRAGWGVPHLSPIGSVEVLPCAFWSTLDSCFMRSRDAVLSEQAVWKIQGTNALHVEGSQSGEGGRGR